MNLSPIQIRLLIGLVAAFVVAIIPSVGIPAALITPLQALVAGIGGVLQMSPTDTVPPSEPITPLTGVH